MDACHYRTADAKHQSDAGDEEKYRRDDADSGKSITAYTVSYECSVCDIEHHHCDHCYESREKHLAKYLAYRFFSKVYTVSIVFHDNLLYVFKMND